MPLSPAQTAFIFPGQGSQEPGMGRLLAESYPAARAIFEEADSVLGRSLSQICFEGSEEELRRTENAQPALYTAAAAALAALQSEGISAGAVAGHSLGEYTALYAAGALDFASGLKLVELRGHAMERAGAAKPGSMAALLGADEEKARELCRQANEYGILVPANFNSSDQIVISGEVGAIDKAIELGKSLGIKKVIKLNVAGAFHSPLMQEAADLLGEGLANINILTPRLGFVSNVTGQSVSDPEEIRSLLLRQLTECVLWTQCVRALVDQAITDFIEVGPGKVLTGLVRRIDKEVRTWNVSNPDDLAKLKAPGGVGSPEPTDRSKP